jgi:hypothetical protein
MTIFDELTRLLSRYDEGLYTPAEIISVATRMLRGAEDLEDGWRALPEWVRIGVQETLDEAAHGDMVMFHESNVEKALEEMARLHSRLKDAGLLGD